MTDIRTLVRGISDCPCGRAHACPIDCVEIGPRALEKLPALCAPYQKILLVADENTWEVCGRSAAAMLPAGTVTPLVLEGHGHVVIPNEDTIAVIEAALPADADLIVGVGSGVINDLCKHVSFLRDLPYFIVATAPSMDGFASVGAALILEGMKITLNARPPRAILGDTAVLKDAPMDMIVSGWGDIIGKYSCLNDWRLASAVFGEYFCQRVYDIVMDTVRRVESLAEGILARDEAAVGELTEALVAVGIAMAYVGNSRPASGSEHHLSHFFEITGILDGVPYYPHGTDVLYSAAVTARLRREILEGTPARQPFCRAGWEDAVRRIYTASADGVIALQDRLGWHDRDDAEAVLTHWDEIRAILAEAPSVEEMLAMVERIGLHYPDFAAFYGAERIENAVRYAMDLKDRYTVLWLYNQYLAR